MATIKFSQKYEKFGKEMPKKGVLLDVFKTHKRELSESFIIYDTTYLHNGKALQFKLPDADVVVLLFSVEGRLFTSIRRWNAPKEEYYKKNRGKLLKIELENQQEGI